MTLEKTNVMRTDRLWLVTDAITQFERFAANEKVLRAVTMPDLHPGKAIPVGAAFALQNVLWPELIGNDVGCGLRVYKTGLKYSKINYERFARETVQRYLDFQIEDYPDFKDVWQSGTSGVKDEDIRAFLQQSNESADGADVAIVPPETWNWTAKVLGTMGLGNHFVEVQFVEKILDAAICSARGIEKHDVLVTIHSGSRTLGELAQELILKNWGNALVEGDAVHDCKQYLDGCLNFAKCNRMFLGWRMCNSLKKCEWQLLLDSFHNFISEEEIAGERMFVHRKGATRANKDELLILPGSRGSHSYLMLGEGNVQWLNTAAHGAGRKMGRVEAQQKMKHKYHRDELDRTVFGSHVFCEDKSLLYQEAPEAYKKVESVLECLEANNSAQGIATLTPILTIKT